MILLYDLVGRDEARPYSPHCWKVALALAHKRLPFRSVPTRFLDIPNIEGGAAQTVPLIRDGDRVVVESFTIAEYLEDTYPDRPSLFGGAAGRAHTRFVERWSQTQLHPFFGSAAAWEIFKMQDAANTEYFRVSREKRFGKPLEQVHAERDAHRAAFRRKLDPLRSMLSYQRFIGGDEPLFSDYIVFGAFQWVRVTSTYAYLEESDPIVAWLERCLDLHEGFARRTRAAA